MLDMYELKGGVGPWAVEAKGWVQDRKATGEGPPGSDELTSHLLPPTV